MPLTQGNNWPLQTDCGHYLSARQAAAKYHEADEQSWRASRSAERKTAGTMPCKVHTAEGGWPCLDVLVENRTLR